MPVARLSPSYVDTNTGNLRPAAGAPHSPDDTLSGPVGRWGGTVQVPIVVFGLSDNQLSCLDAVKGVLKFFCGINECFNKLGGVRGVAL